MVLYLRSRNLQPTTTFHNHIIHLAASPPDSAERPMWNVSPLLDSLTWDTLPAELRKVCIVPTLEPSAFFLVDKTRSDVTDAPHTPTARDQLQPDPNAANTEAY